MSAIIGLALGLTVTWVVWPVEFKNADLADLRQPLKEDYVRMASQAYEKNANLEAAQQRIQTLGLTNSTLTFDDLIQREKSSSTTDTRDALIHLGQALGLKLPYTAQRPAPGVPTPISVYIVATPVPTVLTFRLVEHAQLSCADEPETAHLRIIVRNAAGRDLPNIGIEVRGNDTTETIYTGLKPERGIGYADYEVTPGTFSVRILEAESETISDLVVGPVPVDCRTDRGATPRGWKLIFQQK
ncbi:MAG: hypothetical protein HZB51_09315 [Chloroflexi bacterium]|nr:hypothetical protein [Chloroflexota bacterium]